jgi:WD40 repeat protein
MSKFVRQSKYRHVFGQALKPELCYSGITLSRNAWDQDYITVNSKFMSIAWESGGGAAAVIPLEKTGKLPQGNIPLVSGHKGAVLDMDWHLFNDNILATVSEDGYGRIWSIPDGGLTENLEEPVQLLKGHKRKVGSVRFHPTADNVVVTSSADFTVKIWDIVSGDSILNVEGHTDLISTCNWNKNGSQLVSACKDKKLRIIDPRQQKIALDWAGHAGVKGSRAIWIGDKNWIFSVGFTRTSEREFNLWDPRSLEKPISHTNVDSASGLLAPFYDEDSHMIYLAGKGDGNIRYFEVVDDAPHIFYLSEYKSASPQRGLNFLPKRACNTGICEVMRGYKVTPSLVEPISFTVPRRSDLFQDDLFPPAYAGKPALSAQEWLGGADADPVTMSLEGGFTPAAKSEAPAFQKKEAEKELSEKEVRDEFEKLKTRVAYLEAELAKRDAKIKELESS